MIYIYIRIYIYIQRGREVERKRERQTERKRERQREVVAHYKQKAPSGLIKIQLTTEIIIPNPIFNHPD